MNEEGTKVRTRLTVKVKKILVNEFNRQVKVSTQSASDAFTNEIAGKGLNNNNLPLL